MCKDIFKGSWPSFKMERAKRKRVCGYCDTPWPGDTSTDHLIKPGELCLKVVLGWAHSSNSFSIHERCMLDWWKHQQSAFDDMNLILALKSIETGVRRVTARKHEFTMYY